MDRRSNPDAAHGEVHERIEPTSELNLCDPEAVLTPEELRQLSADLRALGQQTRRVWVP